MPTFVVTGASSGIGRATAAALADRGADVIAVARRREPLAELAATHDTVTAVVADLSTAEGIDTLVAAVPTDHPVDGIVHAAGSLVPVAPYRGLAADELTAHFRIHVATPIEITNRFADRLAGGRAIYIDSYSAGDPRDGWAGYSIVKAAAQMSARAAAQELDDIDVVRIFPGGVRTELVEAVLDSPGSPAGDAFRAYDDAGQIAEPDEVGAFVAIIALLPRAELAEREFWDFNADR